MGKSWGGCDVRGGLWWSVDVGDCGLKWVAAVPAAYIVVLEVSNS